MFWHRKKESKTSSDNKQRYAFKVNQRLRLILSNKGRVVDLVTVIQDVLEDRIRILKLEKAYETLLEDKNITIDVELYENDGLYRFKSEFLGTVSDNLEMSELAKPSVIHRQQRREYQRLAIDWQIRYAFPTKVWAKHPYLKQRGLFVGQDISASGIRLAAKQDIPRGVLCNLEFILDPSYRNSLKVTAKVIGSKKDIVGKIYMVRMEFVDIADDTRVRIDNYVRKNI